MELIRQHPSREPNEYQIAQIARKFGMFIHFGINTFGNVEWSDGNIPALAYRPSSVNAEQWIKTAYIAGMNYVVLITKHHDGFCMWDTEYTDYCIKKSGNPTDVVREVADACKKYGIKLGLYYSLWDRHEKSYKTDFDGEYIPYMHRQLTELLDGRYGEIVELWLDGAWDKPRTSWKLEELYNLVKQLQPRCQIGINHTVGVDFNRAEFPEERYQPQNYQELDPLRMFPSDFRLWDPYPCRLDDPKLYTYQNNIYYLPFEMTICSRDGFSWFYSNFYETVPLMDIDTVVKNCRTAFNASNLVLINMPPDINGQLVQSDVEHLMEISNRLGLSRN